MCFSEGYIKAAVRVVPISAKVGSSKATFCNAFFITANASLNQALIVFLSL